jgi:hypothetical protein
MAAKLPDKCLPRLLIEIEARRGGVALETS